MKTSTDNKRSTGTIDSDTFDAPEIPVPHHSWETTKRCIRHACVPDGHEWAELAGLDAEGYWRECKVCGITDVTAAALGQDVETPNVDQKQAR